MARSLNPTKRVQWGRQGSTIQLLGQTLRWGKLRSKWQGPYTVINTSPQGVITIQEDDGNIFRVNGQRLKVFLEPSYNINLEIDRIDLIAFDKFIQNSRKYKNNSNIFFHLLKIQKCCFIFISKLSWPNDLYALTRQTMILAWFLLITWIFHSLLQNHVNYATWIILIQHDFKYILLNH